jgi:hypothetical protein
MHPFTLPSRLREGQEACIRSPSPPACGRGQGEGVQSSPLRTSQSWQASVACFICSGCPK